MKTRYIILKIMTLSIFQNSNLTIAQTLLYLQRKKLKTEKDSMKNQWILCPVCGSKTRDRLREDTVLKNYPLYCPKCKQETLINAKELHITVIKEPDAQTQSR